MNASWLLIAGLALASGCGVPGQDDTAEAVGVRQPLPMGWNAAWDRTDVGFSAVHSGVTPSVTALDGGQLAMAYVLADPGRSYGHAIVRTGDGKTWGGAQDLGEDYRFDASKPVGITLNGGHLIVAAVDLDGNVWNRYALSGQWTPWVQISGAVTLAGVALVSAGGTAHLIYVGTDGQLNDVPGWGGPWWQSPVIFGGSLDRTSPPAAATWGGTRVDVLVRGADGSALQFTMDNDYSLGWNNLGMAMSANGGGLASWGVNRLDVFIANPDGAIYQRTFDNAWGSWTLVRDCAAGAPRAVSSGWQRINLFVLGMLELGVYHDLYGWYPSAIRGAVPYCCGKLGFECCPAPAPQKCQGEGIKNLTCSPTLNRCVECGSAPDELCCTLNRLPSCAFDPKSMCNPWTGTCETTSRCGTVGNACCFNGCRDGSKCHEVAPGTGVGWCEIPAAPTCAGSKQSCTSTANCCKGLVCSIGKCLPAPGGTCLGGQIGANTGTYPIGVKDWTGCAAGVMVYVANSKMEATVCAERDFPNDPLVEDDPQLVYYPIAQISSYDYNQCTQLYLPAFSQIDADFCEQNLCKQCRWREGACPDPLP